MLWLPALLLGGYASRALRTRMAMLGVATLLLGGFSGLTACGNGVNESRTPLGSTVVTVAAASGATVHDVIIYVAVTSPAPTN